MTGEVKQEQKQEQEAVVYTPIEEKAMIGGWKPKDVWISEGGVEDDWRPAKEFVDRGELFKKIDDLKRDNRSVKQTLNQFKKHYESVKEVEYKRALETLKANKKAALEAGDADQVIKIDDEIDTTKEALRTAKQEQQVPEIHPEFVEWSEKNRWYQNNVEMKEFADAVGTSYAKTHLGAQPSEVLKWVEERVAKAYPEVFKNPKRSQATAVEGGHSPRKSVDTFQLDDDQQRVMKRLVAQGVLTEEQYIKDAKELAKRGR